MKDYLVRTYGLSDNAVIAIPLWAQPDLDHLQVDAAATKRARERLALSAITNGDLMVLYAGNMGVMHPVEILAGAAARVRSLPVSFVFVGDGTKRLELERLTRQLSLEKVQFLPFQPIREFELLVQAADVCAVVLQNGLENLCLPSRTPTFMSGGRPILAVMSEHAPQSREMVETGAGWSADSVEGVAALLEGLVHARDQLSLAGSAARSVYRRNYRRETLVGQYVHAILRSGAPRQGPVDLPGSRPQNLAPPRPS
jgi:glycosyltransferase involved in cell wall biosynthesis